MFQMDGAAESCELLVLIIDMNPFFWSELEKRSFTYTHFVESFMVFLNAYIATNRNGLLVLVANDTTW